MTEIKTDWYVSLFGNEEELRRLYNFLDSPNCYLEKLEPNQICYLTSCLFSNLEEADDVYNSAEKLLTMIKAFAKLELGGEYQSVHIGKGRIVAETKNVASIIKRVDGSQSVGVYPIPVGVTATALPVRVSGAELVEPPNREKRIHDDYLNRCDEKIDGDVFDALYYFAEESSFYSLYKAYETIKLDVDGNKKLDKSRIYDYQWAKEDDVRDFDLSANCHGAVRDPEGKYKLRHSIAECRRSRDKPRAILELQDAESFIKHLMKKWLQWKRCQAFIDALVRMLLIRF